MRRTGRGRGGRRLRRRRREHAHAGHVVVDEAAAEEAAREKSLIALAVAHAVKCPYCIDAYSTDTLEKGCNLDQMTEAIHVAAAITGGAALVHGVQMRGHVQKQSM